jgi:non-homologous end joining protein Ku
MVLAARDEDSVPGHHQEEPAPPAQAIELMDALKASIEARKGFGS